MRLLRSLILLNLRSFLELSIFLRISLISISKFTTVLLELVRLAELVRKLMIFASFALLI